MRKPVLVLFTILLSFFLNNMAVPVPQVSGASGIVSKVGVPVQVYVDPSFYRLNFSMFVYEFYRGTVGSNKIMNRQGQVQVYDERFYLEYQSGKNWKTRGIAENVYLTKVNDYHYEVTRTYFDGSTLTRWNVTFTVKSDQKVKITVAISVGLSASGDVYRLSWEPSGIANTKDASKLPYSPESYGVTFGDNRSFFNWIRFDWSDVYRQYPSMVTNTSYSNVAQGRKATFTFNIGVINVGQVAVIDPSTVGTSTSSASLAWGGMTQSHYESSGAYYWQGLMDGSNFVFEYSSDNVNWGNTPITAISGWVRPVAVAFAGTVIHMVYGDTVSGGAQSLTVHMHYKRGVISGTSISFDAERTLKTWTQGAQLADGNSFILDMRYYAIAVGTDNLLTVIWTRNGYLYFHTVEETYYASRYVYEVIKSTSSDGSGWGSVVPIESDNSFWPDDTSTVVPDTSGTTGFYSVDNRPRLEPLASTVIQCYCNKDGVLRKHKSTAWTTFTTIDSTIKDVNAWGSVTSGDGDNDALALWIDSDDTCDGEWQPKDGSTATAITNLFAATVSCPTVCSNNVTNGAWYGVVISGTSIVYKRCTQYGGTWDSSATNLATGQTSPVDLSSARTILNSRLLISWQTGSASPYTVNFQAQTLNVAPNAPTLSAPAVDGKVNPSSSVAFSWTFSDPDSGDTQGAYQLQIDDDQAFGSPFLDTGKVSSSSSSTSRTVPSTLGAYFWRVKTWDNSDAEGSYCSERRFYVNRIQLYSLSVLASSGSYQTQFNISARWELDSSAVNSGSFKAYDGSTQVGSASSSATGLIQFTLTNTLRGSGTLTVNGTKDGVSGTVGLTYSVTASGSAFALCPETWTVGTPQSMSISFTNAAHLNNTKIKLESVRVHFRVLAGTTVLWSYNASSFDVDANTLKSFSQSLTITGISQTGSFTLRCMIIQLGSESTLATLDRTVKVQALGDTPSTYTPPPKLTLPLIQPIVLKQGEEQTLTFTVQLSQVGSASFVASSPTGVPSSWIFVVAPSTISVSSPAELQILLKIPVDAPVGEFQVVLPISAVASSGSSNDALTFTVTVQPAPKAPSTPSLSLIPFFEKISFPVLLVVGVVVASICVLAMVKTGKKERRFEPKRKARRHYY